MKSVADETKKALQKGNGSNIYSEKQSVIKTFANLNSIEIEKQLSKYLPTVAQVLPKHISKERMLTVFTTIISDNIKLKNCTPASLIGALLQASIVGLDPSPVLKQCYIIPYGNIATFQTDYRGEISLAKRNGNILELYAEVVYEGDIYDETLGVNRDIKHIRKNQTQKPSELTNAYAVVKYTNGGKNFYAMNKKEVYRIRGKSKSPKKDKFGKPTSWYGEDEHQMWKKTALRQLLNLEPFSIEDKTRMEAANISITDPDKFRVGKELDESLYDYISEDIQEPEKVDKITGEIKELENNKQMTSKEFLSTCQKSKKELFDIFGDDKNYDKVLKKYNCNQSEQCVKSQYNDILREFEALIKESQG